METKIKIRGLLHVPYEKEYLNRWFSHFYANDEKNICLLNALCYSNSFNPKFTLL